MYNTGKTNGPGDVYYGRAMRNKDVRLCCVGGYAFYLITRFSVTKEFTEGHVDWTDNSTWFNIKMLVGPIASDTTKPLSSNSYSKWMKELLTELNIYVKHIIHLGRIWGSVFLDMLEAESSGTTMLGNWAPTVRDRSYSIKLPIKTMRMKAGFCESEGMHFNVRTTVKPPDALREKLFPFVEDGVEAIKAVRDADAKAASDHLLTALAFLGLLDHLRDVALQDAAAMMVLHEERTNNVLYEMPIFRSRLFKVSRLIGVIVIVVVFSLCFFFLIADVCSHNEASVASGDDAACL